MITEDWIAVTVASYPCYIVVSLANWGSRLWDQRRQHMALDFMLGRNRRGLSGEVGLNGWNKPKLIWNGDFSMSGIPV